MARYGNNIRRIAQTEALFERIRQAEQQITLLEKAGIPGARAIAYPTSTSSGAPGVTAPTREDSPDARNVTDRSTLEGGGIDDNTNDGDDILNGDKTFEKGEDAGAIRLKDCESGEEIDIRFNTGGNDGESVFKHPEGWNVDGPQGFAPGWEDWVLGIYYTGAGTYFSSTDAPTPELLVEESVGYVHPSLNYSVTDVRDVIINSTANGGTYQAYLDWSDTSSPSNTGWVTAGFTYSTNNCGVETGTPRCPVAAPEAYENWQEQDPDFVHQLAFSAKDGGFVSSQYDDGLPLKFRNDVGSGRGMNNLNLCTLDGNQVGVSALTDGSFAFFEEDGFGFPEEDAKIFHFDSNGKYQDLLRDDEYRNLRSTANPAA